jgi:uncharacterized membrane protein
MALVMVQGHVSEALLSAASRADPLYQLQNVFHGSTAPGFLFASGFVAGLPRAPLSPRAALRRARRLLFILGVGYAIHLPYFSLWKTWLEASAAERAALFACDALQSIAVTQMLALLLQWIFGKRWTAAGGLLSVVVIAATPAVWTARLSEDLPQALGAYLDPATGSRFPLFPFSAFVLAGAVAGAAIGRQEPRTRRRRALRSGLGLCGLGAVLALVLHGRVDFWGPSPAYVILRLGGLLLLLRAVEAACLQGGPGTRALALVGRETLLVYVLHLCLLFGGVFGPAPLQPWAGRLGFGATALVLLGMLPVLLLAAWAWHRVKARAPAHASLALTFVTVAFVFELLARPW